MYRYILYEFTKPSPGRVKIQPLCFDFYRHHYTKPFLQKQVVSQEAKEYGSFSAYIHPRPRMDIYILCIAKPHLLS